MQPFWLCGQAQIESCTGPRPIFWCRSEPRLNWIEVNVLADAHQVGIIFNVDRTKPALEQRPIALTQSIDGLRKPTRHPLHCHGQTSFRRVQQKMEVIWKNAVSVHLDLVEGTRVTKLAKKYPRDILIEDARTINSAVHDMMPRALEIHS
jgi:hypothetical protein